MFVQRSGRTGCYYARTKAVARGTIDQNILYARTDTRAASARRGMDSDLINEFAEFCVRYGMSRSKYLMLSELHRAEN
jgi:hypothetical protein